MKLTMDDEDLAPGPTEPAAPAPAPDLSVLLIGLLKGVLYREADERQWSSLLQLQADSGRPGNALPMLGEAASRSYQRYLDSFSHPIPEYFEAALPDPKQGGSSR